MSWIFDPNKGKIVAKRDKEGNEEYLNGYNEHNTKIMLKGTKKEEPNKPKTEKELLREECDKLGLEYTNRTNIKDLKALIEEAKGVEDVEPETD